MFVYLIGEPGVGKSTTLKAYWQLTANRNEPEITESVPHTKYYLDEQYLGLEIGNPKHRNELHPGTDTLSYNIMPKAIEWVKQREDPLIIGEGDRLANPKFWRAAQDANHRILIIHLTGPARARRINRGTVQNETWLKSRATRVKNLVDNYPHTHIDTLKTTPQETAQTLNEIIQKRKNR